MKKEKIHLKALNVTSFVTSLKKEQLNALKAGLVDEVTTSAIRGTCGAACPPITD